MDQEIRNLKFALGRVNQRQVQFVVLLITLVLFALVGGAPEAGGSCSLC